MSLPNAEHWKMREEEALTIAEQTKDKRCRQILVRIAADYRLLAKHADDHAATEATLVRLAADIDDVPTK